MYVSIMLSITFKQTKKLIRYKEDSSEKDETVNPAG